MDGRSQVRLTVALVVRTATWLRDEEAAGSNPATPTRAKGHLRSSRVAFSAPYSRGVGDLGADVHGYVDLGVPQDPVHLSPGRVEQAQPGKRIEQVY